jgi:hypothetical protein
MCVAATFVKEIGWFMCETLTSHIWILSVSSVYLLLHVGEGGVVRFSDELSGINKNTGHLGW